VFWLRLELRTLLNTSLEHRQCENVFSERGEVEGEDVEEGGRDREAEERGGN
jgi:hypothetical protein